MDFSIRLHFIALRNSASEESEDEIPLNLLDNVLALYLRARTFVCFSSKGSLQTGNIKLENQSSKA